MMASNPVLPLISSPSPAPDSSLILDPIGSEFDDEDEELESNSTSHPTSPEKLDIVSTSSFVFDPRPHHPHHPHHHHPHPAAHYFDASCAQHDSSSPTHYEESVCGKDATNGYQPTGSAVGGTTIVEEQIETIITTEGLSDDGSASQSSCTQRNLFPDPDESLALQLDLEKPAIRVPFPELGLDLVEVHLLSLLSPEERAATTSSEIRLTELKSWDENWLFKQRKKKPNSVSSYFAFADLDFASEPVRMFIPNPTSQQAKASIGQQDVDDLTDLSEKNSVASLSFSSDSESEADETTASGDHTSPSHQQPSIMTQSGLLHKNANHKRIVTEADRKPQSAQQSQSKSCPSESERGKCLSQSQHSKVSVCPAPPIVTSHVNGVTIKSAKESCFPPKLEQRHDHSSLPSSSSSVIALPSFVPLSRRMESSRCDPCFVIKPCGASVQTAILIQFCCRVKGSRPLGVAWFKGDHLLSDNDSFRIFSSGNEFVLEIRNTQLTHTDVYSCVVYNGFGEQWSDFNLVVKERPRSPVTASTMPRSQRATTLVKSQRCLNRGIDIDLLRTTKSPRIVTQTWAERSTGAGIGAGVQRQRESSLNEPVMTGSGKNRTEERNETSLPVVSEKDRSKWNKSPQKLLSEERKQIPPAQRPVIFSSTGRVVGGSGDDVGRESESRHQEATACDDKVDRANGIVSLSSRCKDLSIYKRDYFVPSARDETLNGLDEKVYETSKFFSLQPPDEKEDGNSSADETSIHTTGSPSVSGSLAESYFSQKDSGQGDETTVVDEEEETTDDTEERGGVSPSVKKLVRRFSRKELPKTSCTYSSCSNLYEDCDGKGVVPKRHTDFSPEVHSPVARSLNKFFRERNSHASAPKLNRFGSFSMCDIDQISVPPRAGFSSSSVATSSPTNEGYNSDDSALSVNTSLKNNINNGLKSDDGSVEVMPTKKVNRTIMKRASFWQKRCEKGLLSDSSVAEEFPGMDCIYD